jgi:transcriptional regulator with XRE-family HTH domain
MKPSLRLSTNLRTIRLYHRLSYKTVEEATGVLTIYIHKLEKRQTNIMPERLEKLAAYYGYSIADLNNYDIKLTLTIENPESHD